MATSFHGNLLRVLDLLEIEHRLRRLRQSNHLFSLDSFFLFLSLSLFPLAFICKRILAVFRKDLHPSLSLSLWKEKIARRDDEDEE